MIKMKTVNFGGSKRVPSKVVCVGRNYMAHISELGNAVPEEIVFFFKPNAAISDELRSFCGEPLHYEGEICFGVEAGEFRYIGFGLDLTKRETQSRLKENGLPWERAKAFRGAAVLGDFVPIRDGFDQLEIELLIDGERAQIGSIDEMIHKPQSILAEARSFIDLEDFDIVMSGTPSGVGPVRGGALYEGVVRQAGRELLRASWRAI